MKTHLKILLIFAATSGECVFASASVSAAVTGACQSPTPGTNVTVTNGSGDKFSANLTTGTITPTASSTIFSLTPSGNVCRFSVTVGSTASLGPLFAGMTFANPSLAVKNSNVDTTGQGGAGSAADTTAFTMGALTISLALTTPAPASRVEIKKRATAATNFYFGTSTSAITLTNNPTDESGLSASGNALFTITLTLVQVAG